MTVQVLRVLFLELVQMVWYWYFFSLILAAMAPEVFKAYQNNASYLVPRKENSNGWRGPGGIGAESVACGDFIAPY